MSNQCRHKSVITPRIRTIVLWAVVGLSIILTPLAVWWYYATMQPGIGEAIVVGVVLGLCMGLVFGVVGIFLSFLVGSLIESLSLVSSLIRNPTQYRTDLKPFFWAVGKTMGSLCLLVGMVAYMSDLEVAEKLVNSEHVVLKALGYIGGIVAVGIVLCECFDLFGLVSRVGKWCYHIFFKR